MKTGPKKETTCHCAVSRSQGRCKKTGFQSFQLDGLGRFAQTTQECASFMDQIDGKRGTPLESKKTSCANPASPHVTPQRWFKSLSFENFVQKTTTPDQMVAFASKVLIRGRFTDLASCSSNLLRESQCPWLSVAGVAIFRCWQLTQLASKGEGTSGAVLAQLWPFLI